MVLQNRSQEQVWRKRVRKQCGVAQNSQGKFLEQIVLREGHER